MCTMRTNYVCIYRAIGVARSQPADTMTMEGKVERKKESERANKMQRSFELVGWWNEMHVSILLHPFPLLSTNWWNLFVSLTFYYIAHYHWLAFACVVFWIFRCCRLLLCNIFPSTKSDLPEIINDIAYYACTIIFIFIFIFVLI